MAEKEQLIREKIAHSGIFNFKGLYTFMHQWLKEEKDYGVIEEKYNEKVSGESRDLVIEWMATKRYSDYFKSEVKLKFEIEKMTDVEVEIDGTRKQMQKGKITIEFKGSIVKDPDSKWDKKPFLRFLRDVYNKYVIPGRVAQFEELIKGDVMGAAEEMKAFVEMSGKLRT